MDTGKQMRVITEQFVKIFTKDKLLPLRIVLFIITGAAALWFYVTIAITLFIVRMLFMVSMELHLFINNENKPGLLRSAMLFAVYPITMLRYCTIPFMYLELYWENFFFNCFAFVSSLGKSGWKGFELQFEEKVDEE